ncbi:MAG: MFS transporter [Schwartzia sp.]|nr:MFS transporter [Schwartzia sp. (in: firmicutes)]
MSDSMSININGIKHIPGLLALLIFSVSLFLYHLLAFDTAPVGTVYKFTAVGGISSGQNGRHYIIDNGRKDIIIANDHWEFVRAIRGEQQEDGFMYATGVRETENGDIFVTDIVYDGTSTRVQKERILRYRPDFSFRDVVYERVYTTDDMPHLYGTIRKIKPIGNELSIIVVQGDRLEHSILNPDTKELKEQRHATIWEGIIDASYDNVSKGIFISTKGHTLLRMDADGSIATIDDKGFPWAVMCFDGRLYYTDAVTTELKCPRLLQPILAKNVYANNFYVSGNKIFYYLQDTVYELENNNTVTRSTLTYDRLPLRILLQCLILVSAIMMVVRLIKEYRQHIIERVITDNTLPKRMPVVLGMIVLTGLLVTAIVMNMFINELRRSDDTALESSFRYTAALMEKRLPPDTLMKLITQGSHTSPEYTGLKQELDFLIGQWQSSESGNPNSYYTYNLIYTVDNKVAQLMNREGTFVPGRILPTTSSQYYYLKAVAENTSTFVHEEQDSYGTWSYHFRPLKSEDGATIGALVVAAKVDALRQLRQARYWEIAASSIMTMIIVVMSIIELIFFLVHWVDKQAKRMKRRHICDYAPIRMLEFLRSLQLGLVTPFLLQSFAHLAEASNLTNALWVTLPFSLSFVAGMIATVLSGRFFVRQGSSMALFVGHCLYLPAGLLFLTTESYLPWLVAYLLGGFAWEFIFNSMSITAGATESEKARSRALSDLMSGRAAGIAVGSGLGSIILTFFSVRAVFELYTAIAVVCLLLVALSRNYLPEEKEDCGAENASPHGPRFLMFNRDTFGVLFLLFLVISVLRCYRDVALPLYSMEHSISAIELGRVMMLACLFATYVAPVIIRTLRQHFGNRHAAVVSNILMVAPLLLLPVIPSKYTVYLACFVIELFYAAGRPYQNGLFMSLSSVQAAGPSTAQTVFGIYSTAGSALGPIIFSVLFDTLGIMGGNVALAVITIACALLFLTVTTKAQFTHGPATNK